MIMYNNKSSQKQNFILFRIYWICWVYSIFIFLVESLALVFKCKMNAQLLHRDLIQITETTVQHCIFLEYIFTDCAVKSWFNKTRQSQNLRLILSLNTGLNLWRQIQRSNDYQIDRLIHEDAGRVDSSDLYETQARAARRNYLFFWCMDPAVEPSSRKVQLSSGLCRDPFQWIHSPLSLWQTEGNGWGARFHQKAHLHPHDKVFHKGEAAFFERGPSWSSPHMVLINSCGPEVSIMLLFWGRLLKIQATTTLNKICYLYITTLM